MSSLTRLMFGEHARSKKIGYRSKKNRFSPVLLLYDKM